VHAPAHVALDHDSIEHADAAERDEADHRGQAERQTAGAGRAFPRLSDSGTSGEDRDG
jgi:hypothetical protein